MFIIPACHADGTAGSRSGESLTASYSAGTILAEHVYWNNQPRVKSEGMNDRYYHNGHLVIPQNRNTMGISLLRLED